VQPGSTILAIDDERFNLVVLRLMLERAGFRVFTARDGLEALTIIGDQIPDVIILDLKMPRLDGLSTLAAIAEDSRLRGIPVIVVSSIDDEETVAASLRAGAIAHLSKPVDMASLVRAIQSLPAKSG
jgi:CheY-like chemotaxis protein